VAKKEEARGGYDDFPLLFDLATILGSHLYRGLFFSDRNFLFDRSPTEVIGDEG
jgi:hypothetical protein